ncbi:hypothetical protein Efla_007110 [Eimeria flavescens]
MTCAARSPLSTTALKDCTANMQAKNAPDFRQPFEHVERRACIWPAFAPFRLHVVLIIIQLCISAGTASRANTVQAYGNHHKKAGIEPRFLSSTPLPQEREAAHAKILSAMKTTYDVLGATLSTAATAQAPPRASNANKHAKASDGQHFGILVCIVVFIAALGLAFIGAVKMVRTCKRNISRRRARSHAHAASCILSVQSAMQLPRPLPTERKYPLFEPKANTNSLSAACSSRCGDNVPSRPSSIFLSPTRLPSSPSSLHSFSSSDGLAQSIEYQCRSQQAFQCRKLPAYMPTVPPSAPAQKAGLLSFWRHGDVSASHANVRVNV